VGVGDRQGAPADGRVLVRLLHSAVQCFDVEAELAQVLGLEAAELDQQLAPFGQQAAVQVGLAVQPRQAEEFEHVGASLKTSAASGRLCLTKGKTLAATAPHARTGPA
jgi:hypothetical protein